MTKESPCILVIDDDTLLAEAIVQILRQQGYNALYANDGLSGLLLADSAKPDLVILDVMMPKLNGWEVCRNLKADKDVMVLLLTAKGSESDILQGFACGADDYLRKPFSLAELLARIKVLLQAENNRLQHANGYVLRSHGLELNINKHSVTLNGQPIHTTPTEFRLLTYFMQNAGRVISQQELLSAVWGTEYADESQYLMYYIRYLRKKLQDNADNPQMIVTVRGQGYMFN